MKKLILALSLFSAIQNAQAVKVFDHVIVPLGIGLGSAAIYGAITSDDDSNNYNDRNYRREHEYQRQREYEEQRQREYEHQQELEQQREYHLRRERRMMEHEEMERLRDCRHYLRHNEYAEYDYHCR